MEDAVLQHLGKNFNEESIDPSEFGRRQYLEWEAKQGQVWLVVGRKAFPTGIG